MPGEDRSPLKGMNVEFVEGNLLDPPSLVRAVQGYVWVVLFGALLAVVLLLLFWKTRARWKPGLLVGLFTLGIGVGRFVAEFFREPDCILNQEGGNKRICKVQIRQVFYKPAFHHNCIVRS